MVKNLADYEYYLFLRPELLRIVTFWFGSLKSFEISIAAKFARQIISNEVKTMSPIGKSEKPKIVNTPSAVNTLNSTASGQKYR